MNGDYLFLALIVTSLAGALGSIALRHRERACRTFSFGAAMVSSALGMVCALDVLLGSGTISISLPVTIPALGSFSFTVDQLGAYFLLTVSVLAFVVSIYSLGYMKEYEGRYSAAWMGFVYNIFLLSMVLVVTASNAVLFLIVWETMSIFSYLLVVYENKKKESVSAGLLYVVMTHLGTAFIMVGFILMWTYTGSFDYSSLTTSGAVMPDVVKSVAFLLFLLGFGTKAGIIPLHVWLPQAHPAAPSNISALMSGVMVKTAILMLIRVFFDFLGVTDTWWGLLVLLIACVSALLGVLYALMEKDLKKVLAYSTVENVGLIFIALGAAMVFQASYLQNPLANSQLADLAALALIAVLFHVLAHSLFKGLLFMGAGSVLYSTHTKDMEELGGLAKRMRWTSVLVFIGTLSIAAIPPFNGFVSEWLMFQSLLLSLALNDAIVNLLIPVAVGILALTGALVAACFVRLFGITFLARPRSAHAEEAKEVPRSMLVGMGITAALCVLMGVLSVFIIPVIDTVSASVLHVSISSKLVDGLVLSPPANSFSSMSPLVLGALLLFLVPAAFLISRRLGGRTETVKGDTWDCGTPLSSRTEYTAAGFSQPINRVFSSIIRPHNDTRFEYTSSPYIKKRISFARTIEPVFEKYLYSPLTALAVGAAKRITVIQKGSIQAYLAYIFATLLILLVVFR